MLKVDLDGSPVRRLEVQCDLGVQVGTILTGADALQEELAHRHLFRRNAVAGGTGFSKRFKLKRTTLKGMGF